MCIKAMRMTLLHCRCSGDVPYITVDDFETNLRYIIEEVRSKIPKVFVNLVEIFNMSMVRHRPFI